MCKTNVKERTAFTVSTLNTFVKKFDSQSDDGTELLCYKSNEKYCRKSAKESKNHGACRLDCDCKYSTRQTMAHAGLIAIVNTVRGNMTITAVFGCIQGENRFKMYMFHVEQFDFRHRFHVKRKPPKPH